MGAIEVREDSLNTEARVEKMAEVMSTTQMFVGNLPWSVRTKHLEEDFGKYGEVTDAFVAYKGRRSRGFGFVTMAKADEASKAQKAMDGKQVGEGEQAREMRVTFAKQRSAEDQAKADAAKEAAATRREEKIAKKKEAKEEGGAAKAEPKPKKEAAAKDGDAKEKKTRPRGPRKPKDGDKKE